MLDFPRYYQTTDYNCFPTAVACVIGVYPDMLPQLKMPWPHMWNRPKSRWGQWQKKSGYVIKQNMAIPKDKLYVGLYRLKERPRDAHAVVCYNGEIVHNPAGKGAGRLQDEPYNVVLIEKS